MNKFTSKTYPGVINAESKPFSRHAETLRAVVSASNKKGFTLIELLVVVLIIGVLASMALPQYTLAVEKARVSEAVSVLRTLMNAEKVYYMANGQYADNFDELDVSPAGEKVNEKNIKTQYFTFRIHTEGTASNFHIDAARLTGQYELDGWLGPASATYDKIMCYTKFTELGEKVCRSLGVIDPAVSSTYYTVY